MKIKTVKKMRLDKLIKYIYDNNEANRIFIDDDEDFAVHTNSFGAVSFEALQPESGRMMVAHDRIFTVEVEEELTEDTEFDVLWESYWDSEDLTMRTRIVSARIHTGDDEVSIKGIKSTNGDISKAVAIFYKDTLIWSAEHGIPESGVLEVVEF